MTEPRKKPPRYRLPDSRGYTQPQYREKPEKPCERCGGSGEDYIRRKRADGLPMRSETPEPCPFCGGTGTRRKEARDED